MDLDKPRAAYEAYRDFHAARGLPAWEQLTVRERNAWRIATIAGDLHEAQVRVEHYPAAIARIATDPDR